MQPVDIPYGYCHCGCGEKTKLATKNDSSGKYPRIKGEPMHYIKGHRNFDNSPEYKVEDKGYETHCWIWLRAKNKGGYGISTGRGKLHNLAHRHYYMKFKGTVPKGISMQIDHLCKNRDCVNPNHLELVTHAENLRRSSQAKLTISLARHIRSLKGKMLYREIAAIYHVDRSTVGTIMRNITWKES